MSSIIKTQAIVLSKIKFSDTSKIIQLYTKELGRIPVILKGGRDKNSKAGTITDPLNIIEVMIYNKESREVQTLGNSELINHFGNIREDYDKTIFALAVLELVKELTHEYEQNDRLFRGVTKILEKFESDSEHPLILFGRFYVFLLEILGYELQLEHCTICGNLISTGESLKFKFNSGVICGTCSSKNFDSVFLTPELYHLLVCLKMGKKIENSNSNWGKLLQSFLESYTKSHVESYKGLISLRMF